jgi:hypothetical protein
VVFTIETVVWSKPLPFFAFFLCVKAPAAMTFAHTVGFYSSPRALALQDMLRVDRAHHATRSRFSPLTLICAETHGGVDASRFRERVRQGHISSTTTSTVHASISKRTRVHSRNFTGRLRAGKDNRAL